MHTPQTMESTQDYLDKLQKNAPKDVLDIKTSMRYGAESKYVTINIDPRKKEFKNGIEVLHITDVQFGHLACNVAKFIEYRDWILSKPNRFVFFGGDMVDAATALSVASPYENTVEPQAQVFQFCELAMPFRHRIIGSVGGNHERRSSKAFGELGRLIATILKIPYSSGKQFVDINYGDHKPFKNSLWHGGTGSKTKGAKAQMISRFMGQAESDVYWVGHLHDVLMVGDVRERRDGKGGIHLQKYCGVMSSSFLEHYGTYAEVMGLPANDCQMWRLILTPDGHWEMTLR